MSAKRDSGLVRLSRLTWRATLLSLVAAFVMATLFAKTAAHSVAGSTTGNQTPAGASPTASPSWATTSTPANRRPTFIATTWPVAIPLCCDPLPQSPSPPAALTR